MAGLYVKRGSELILNLIVCVSHKFSHRHRTFKVLVLTQIVSNEIQSL